MNRNSFDHTWTFISGTKCLEHFSTYLNVMGTENRIIVVAAEIDPVDEKGKSVSYLVAYKPNPTLNLNFQKEDGLH